MSLFGQAADGGEASVGEAIKSAAVQKNELPLSLRIKSSAVVQVLLQCHHIRPLSVL